MKKWYLILTIIGFILPGVLVFQESIETGNVLLYTDFEATFNQMFANRISTIFAIDLFYVVFLFLGWVYIEARKNNMKNWWWIWLWTFAFGLASGLPLFLYWREIVRERRQASH